MACKAGLPAFSFDVERPAWRLHSEVDLTLSALNTGDSRGQVQYAESQRRKTRKAEVFTSSFSLEELHLGDQALRSPQH